MSPVVLADLSRVPARRWLTRRVHPDRLQSSRDPALATRLVRTLLETGSRLARATTPEAALRGLVRQLAATLACQGATCLLAPRSRSQPLPLAWCRSGGSGTLEVRGSLFEFVLNTGLAAAVPGTKTAAPQVCVPLTPAEGRTRGALVLLRARGAPDFDLPELELATLVARQLLAVVEKTPTARFLRPGSGDGQPPGSQTLTSTLRRVQRAAEATDPEPETADHPRPRRALAHETHTSLIRKAPGRLPRRQHTRRHRAERRVAQTTSARAPAPAARAPSRAGSERVPLTIEALFGSTSVLPDYLLDEE